MATHFVSRHPGAVEWAKQNKLNVSRFTSHFVIDEIKSGDTVIGSLPVHLAAEVCAKGATYWHLSLAVPFEMRGRELSVADLVRMGAYIKQFHVKSVLNKGDKPS